MKRSWDETKDNTEALAAENRALMDELNSAPVQKIVHKFQETYNGVYLKDLPPSLLTFTSPVLQQLNRTQQMLFENYLTLQRRYLYRIYNAIAGPFFISVLHGHDQDNNVRAFYIFGEQHRTFYSCYADCSSIRDLGTPKKAVPFLNYLKQLTKETPRFLDIYIEAHAFSKGESFLVQSDLEGWKKGVLQYILDLMDSHVFQSKKTLDTFEQSYSPSLWTRLTQTKPVKVPKTPNTELSDDMIENVFDAFFDCFEPSLRQTDDKCRLSRFHFIDIRDTVDSQNTTDFLFAFYLVNECFLTFGPLSETSDREERHGLQEEEEEEEEDYQEGPVISLEFLLSWLGQKSGTASALPTLSLDTIQFFYYYIVNVLKITGLFAFFQHLAAARVPFSGKATLRRVFHLSPKLTEKINKTHVDMRYLIFTFLGQKLDTEQPPAETESLWQYMNTIDANTFDLNNFKNFVFMMAQYISNLGAIIVDCYCLGRVFRKFQHKPGKPLEQPVTPSTYIIYAGAAHAFKYSAFIEQVLQRSGIFTVNVSYTENNFITKKPQKVKSCVNIPPDLHIQ